MVTAGRRRWTERLDVPALPPLVGRTRPTAVLARVLDGEHLWVAVRDADALLLRLPDGGDLPVPSDPDRDGEHPVVAARFPLAAALADLGAGEDELDLPLLARTEHGVVPVRPGAASHLEPVRSGGDTADGRWRLDVEHRRRGLVVTRRPRPPSVTVLDVARHPDVDDGVVVHLDTRVAAVALVVEGRTVAELPLADGRLELTDDLPAPAPGRTAHLEVDGLPLARRRDVLVEPGRGTVLPRLPGSTEWSAVRELRWTDDGHLVVHAPQDGGP